MKAKNIGLLATLALVVTVGGVYATWNYAGTTPDAVSQEARFDITSATSTSKGELSATPNFSITLENDGNYKPVIEWTDTDGVATPNSALLTVGFKPNAENNYEETYGKEIALGAAIRFEGNSYEFGGVNTPIFTTEESARIDVSLNWETTGNAEIDASGFYVAEFDVSALFVVNPNIVLETKAEYDAFAAALDNAKATIYVAETGTDGAGFVM